MKNNYLNIFLISGSGIIGGLLNYIYHPIMLTHLSLEEFGEFGSLVGIFNVLGIFVGGFTYFLTKEIASNIESKTKTRNIFLESTKILGIIGLICYIIFFVFSPIIGKFLKVDNMLLYIVGINIIFSFVGASISSVLMGYKKFIFLGVTNILNPFLKLILGFILVYLGFSVYGAIFGFIFSGILGFFISFFYILNFFKGYKELNINNDVFKDFWKNKISVINFFFVTLFFAILMNVDVILAKNIFSSNEAGIYVGLSVLGKFLIFLLLSIETVYYGQIMEYKKEKLPLHLLTNPLFLISLAGILSIIVNIFIGGFLLNTLKPELTHFKYFYILILSYYFFISYISFFSKILIGWGNRFVNIILGFLCIFLIILVYTFGKNSLENFIYSFIFIGFFGTFFIGFYFFLNYKKNNNKITDNLIIPMKTLLLTGGTGYIGSHGAVSFLEKGYNIIIVDNLSNSKIEVLDSIKKITGKSPIFYQTDLKDKNSLKKVFLENNISGVIHFAGLKAVGESVLKPFEYYENNVIGSLNLFELMEEFSVKNIIFSSSATVYDPSGKSPFKENSQTGNTLNPYGTTKFIIENILRDLSTAKGFNVVNLRYFNPIGAHKSGLIGENPNDIPNNLLPFVMKVASGELDEVRVFGNTYNTKDGTGERDYIHVVDLIDAHVKSLKYLEDNNYNGIFEVFNIGTGKPTSVLEIIKISREKVGKNIKYKIVDKRQGDLAVSFCDPSKAKNILSWEAKYSVEDAIIDSWNFILKQKN